MTTTKNIRQQSVLAMSIGALLFGLTSCSDFLTQDLKGDYSSENFYTSQASATEAVSGVYNALYGNTLWIFGDVASDDAVKGGNAGDQADINAIDNFSAAADNGVISTYWTNTYELIARANSAITNIEAMTFDATVRQRLIAECKVLRAYAYFNLVNIFGEVPLKLKPQLTNEAIHVPLSSTSLIYAQIEQDLRDAAPALPAVYPTEAGRVTQGAAYGLLAKVYLFQQKYADCLTSIASLETSTHYDLVGNYADLFKVGAEDSVETVFCIRYINNDEVSLGNNLNVWFSPASEGGYYFNAPTQSYVDAFTETTTLGATDPRLDASIGRAGQPWFNGTTFLAAWSEATGYLVKKYNEDLSTTATKAQSTIPQHILRYADVLLMKAEALNELGGATAVADAAVEVDKVRARAGLAPTTATTQDDMRTLIRNERRKELGFEFHRFFDLMRYGKTAAQAALGTELPWGATRFYFPLPQTEIDANQGIN